MDRLEWYIVLIVNNVLASANKVGGSLPPTTGYDLYRVAGGPNDSANSK